MPTVMNMASAPVMPTLPDVTPEPQKLMDLIDHKVCSQPLTGVQGLGTPTNAGTGSSNTQGVPPAYAWWRVR